MDREKILSNNVIFFWMLKVQSFPNMLKNAASRGGGEQKVRGNGFLEILQFWGVINCEPLWPAELLWIFRKTWKVLNSMAFAANHQLAVITICLAIN